MKNKKIILGIIIGIITLVIIITLLYIFLIKGRIEQPTTYHKNSEDGTFSTLFIKASHKNTNKKNYMISPYSVEIALSMLRDGAKGNTYKEIEKVCPEREIKTLAVKDKVNIANALFIKNKYKNDVREDYAKNLKENYNAEFLYDDFKTPNVINNWANKETNGIIKKVIDTISPDFVLGLANAVAMEEKWQDEFKCEMIQKGGFTKLDNKKINVSMLSKNYESTASYYEDDSSKAIIIPYAKYDRKTGKETDKEGEQLEYIGILPNDIDKYISDLTLDTIKKIDKEKRTASEDELTIYLQLPKYQYSYDFKKFKKTLIDMGIESVFGPADLSGMVDNHPDLFVDEAVHKTNVEVDEKGTKAAAVTYFGTKDNAVAPSESKHVEIKFDKPFIFIIKDTKSNELLFFGVVYEPNKYEKPNCE